VLLAQSALSTEFYEAQSAMSTECY